MQYVLGIPVAAAQKWLYENSRDLTFNLGLYTCVQSKTENCLLFYQSFKFCIVLRLLLHHLVDNFELMNKVSYICTCANQLTQWSNQARCLSPFQDIIHPDIGTIVQPAHG